MDYNTVVTSHKCSNCTKRITNWQTKDGASVGDRLSPEEVTSYSAICSGCNKFNEYRACREGFALVSR